MNEYYHYVSPILNCEEFKKRKLYQHHENDSVYSHSIKVSILAYKIAKFFRLDSYSVAIGSLLHDFYDEPWQIEGNLVERKNKNILRGHGFIHANQALKNSRIYFPELMNNKVEDIIKKHMFPLNVLPPSYLESWIVTLCDKYVSLDIFKDPKQIPKYIGIKKLPKFITVKKSG